MLNHLKKTLLGATLLSCAAMPALATVPGLPAAVAQITAPIDDSKTTVLAGEHAAALARATDAGALDPGTRLEHITMGLKRSPEMQAAFDKLTSEQMQRGSPNYHAWLKPEQLRDFGPSAADIAKVTGWLTGHGFTVHKVSPSGMTIDFGGTAGLVNTVFHTSLHNVTLGGRAHIANVIDPAIPAALAPVTRGVILANFFPRPMMVSARPLLTLPGSPGQYATQYAVTPADFATIYNLNPLLSGANLDFEPIRGTGVSIALVEQTDIQAADFTTFRNAFGLSGYAGTLSQIHPGGCADPGFTGDEGEAALDGEWAGAAAPDATIIEASCASDNAFGFGVMTTLQELVEGGTPASILSISYGGDEQGDGLVMLQVWDNLIQEGASTGLSIFISTGDSGSSGFYAGYIDEVGLAANGLATSQYDTAVGGTDFADSVLKENSMYWSKKNGPTGQSVLSYVPEVPWNNSCANPLLAGYYKKASLFTSCNTTRGTYPFYEQDGVGGSGGVSLYIAKPSWQAGPGVPKDGARDLPDVSLFASNGVFNHFYLYCMSDANEGGNPCLYDTALHAFGNAAGGTSFASPAFAGIQGLLSQLYGRVGNAAPALYELGAAQFTNKVLAAKCNASLGNKISTACIFNNVTVGTNAEPCYAGTPNCYTDKPSHQIGVLATPYSATTVGPAYPAQPGYSLATGLGSINATNYIYNYVP